jgi:transcription-repair coupling factor (superfamily II helicase)
MKLLNNKVGRVSWDRRKQKLKAKIKSDALIMMRWAKLRKRKITHQIEITDVVDLMLHGTYTYSQRWWNRVMRWVME